MILDFLVQQLCHVACHVDAAVPREDTNSKLVQDPPSAERGMLVTLPRPPMTQQAQCLYDSGFFVNQLCQVARHIDAAAQREGTKSKLVISAVAVGRLDKWQQATRTLSDHCDRRVSTVDTFTYCFQVFRPTNLHLHGAR